MGNQRQETGKALWRRRSLAVGSDWRARRVLGAGAVSHSPPGPQCHPNNKTPRALSSFYQLLIMKRVIPPIHP